MAIIKAGILSKVSGKVAGVVGSTWKGKNYLRELVKPANPNTPLQQAQRGKMGACVKVARTLVGDVFKPYLDKFLKDISGYNWFVKNNIAKFNGSNFEPTEAFDVSFGNLPTGSAYWCDSHSNSGISTGEDIPQVPAGHTLVAVAGLFDITKGVMVVKENAGVGSEESVLNEDDISFTSAGDKTLQFLFFADVDANGVVQALSTNLKKVQTLA